MLQLNQNKINRARKSYDFLRFDWELFITHIKIHVSQQEFSNLASDWLAVAASQ